MKVAEVFIERTFQTVCLENGFLLLWPESLEQHLGINTLNFLA